MDFRQQKACIFFMRMMLANAARICVENPVGIMSKCYRPADQIINPYQFGDPYRKKTCLWLKNLPKLRPTKIVEPKLVYYNRTARGTKGSYSADYGSGNGAHGKRRSKTYPGIAAAMAEQWGILKEELSWI